MNAILQFDLFWICSPLPTGTEGIRTGPSRLMLYAVHKTQ